MTPFSSLENRFKMMVEEDSEFFQYYQYLEYEAEEIMHRRILAYLYEATAMLDSQIQTQIDFTDYNEETEEFNTDLTKKEILLVSSMMFQVYLSRSIAKLKTLVVNYSSSDLKVFDPSNARTSFMTMYEKVCQDNAFLIEEYKSRDRLTGAFIEVGYEGYANIDED